MSDNRLIIFDTTLRDGEQSPGASMNLAEKLEIALALAELGVDVIEAGFPIASPGDFEAVQSVARQVTGPIICGLARCNPADIDRAWEAAQGNAEAAHSRVPRDQRIHREYKLKMAKEEIVRRAVEGVTRARGYCDNIEFSPEDAARTELDFLAEVVEKVIEAGATTLNVPDTVGYAVPEQYAGAIRYLKQNVCGIEKVVLSVHCHNDLGLAVSNSLAALKEGARQVECTINGIGERARTALSKKSSWQCAPRLLQFGRRRTNEALTYRRAISCRRHRHSRAAQQGDRRAKRLRASGHPSGRHAEHANTLRIMKPEDVGVLRTDLVLGNTAAGMLSQRIRDLGYHLDNEQLQRSLKDFKGARRPEENDLRRRRRSAAEAVLHTGTAVWTLEAVSAPVVRRPVAAVVLW